MNFQKLMVSILVLIWLSCNLYNYFYTSICIKVIVVIKVVISYKSSCSYKSSYYYSILNCIVSFLYNALVSYKLYYCGV